MAKFDPEAWLEGEKESARSFDPYGQREADAQVDTTIAVDAAPNQQRFDANAWLDQQKTGITSDSQMEYYNQGFEVVDKDVTYPDNGKIMFNRDTDQLIFVSDKGVITDRNVVQGLMDRPGADPFEVQRMSEQLQGRGGEAFALTAAESLPYVGGFVPRAVDVFRRGYESPEMRAAQESMGFDLDPNAPKSSELISQFAEESPGLSLGAKGLGLVGPMGANLGLRKMLGRTAGQFQQRYASGSKLDPVKQTAYQTARGAVEAGPESAIYEFGRAFSAADRGEFDVGEATQRSKEAGTLGLGVGGGLSGSAALMGELFNKYRNRASVTSLAPAIQKSFGYSPETSKLIEQSIAEGLDLEQAARRLQQLRLRGGVSDATIADADAAAAVLLDAAASATPRAQQEAKRIVGESAERAGERAGQIMDQYFGKQISPLKDPIEEIMKRSRKERYNAYSNAYSQKIDYDSPEGQELISILEDLNRVDPNFVKGISGRIDFLGAFDPDNIKAPLFQDVSIVGKDGSIKYDRAPSVKALDLIKRKINDMAYTPDVDQTEKAALVELSRRLRTALGDAVPEYNAAAKIGGDAIMNRMAYEAGADINKTPISEVFRLARSSKEAKSGLREGVRSNLQRMIDTAKRPATTLDAEEISQAVKMLRDTSSKDYQTKVRLILGKKEAKKFFDELDGIRAKLQTKSLVGTGSATALRQQNIRFIDDITNPALKEAVGSVFTGEFQKGLRQVKDALSSGDPKTRAKIADEMIEFLTGVNIGRRSPEMAISRLQQIKKGKVSEKDIAFIASSYLRTLLALPFAREFSRESDLRK